MIPGQLLAAAHDISRVCLACQHPFVIAAQEAAWFDRMAYHYPKRCVSCRRAKRALQVQQQYEAEQAKANGNDS
ncbi:MAG: zinc-ribbon domain containing protein [Acidobacteria bacterium]|nr:zinc-ribbon domain containing protein [Acidobacteriota bacterium]